MPSGGNTRIGPETAYQPVVPLCGDGGGVLGDGAQAWDCGVLEHPRE